MTCLKAAAFDLDDTLLRNDLSISPFTLDVFRRLHGHSDVHAFHDQESNSVKDQGDGNGQGIVEHLVNLIIKQHADDAYRYAGDQDLEP